MARPRVIVVAAVAALAGLTAVATAQVFFRPVDRDEGFWLYTSWRQSLGEVPYRDYCLPHLPAAPLYYAGAIRVFGPDLYRLRTLNVSLMLAATLLLGAAAGKRFGRPAGVLTAILYLSSSLVLTWLTPIKAYAPATMALVAAAAVAVWPSSSPHPSPLRFFFVGLAVGVAAAARLTLLPVLAAAAAAAWVAAPPGRRALTCLAACGGFLSVTPLLLYYRVATGDAFAFNVWGIHRLLINETPTGRWVALRDLFLPPDPAALILLSAAAAFSRYRRPLAFPLLTAGAILVANLTPGTSQLQYFTPAAPALALGAGVSLAAFYRKKRTLAICAAAAISVVGAARPAAKIAFDRAHKSLVGPAEVYAAAELLQRETDCGDVVFTAWPGYAALARRTVMPRWELGYFTHRLGKLVDAADRRRYHLATYDETVAALAAGDATVVLDGLDTPAALRPALEKYYSPAHNRAGVTLWRYRGPTSGGLHVAAE